MFSKAISVLLICSAIAVPFSPVLAAKRDPKKVIVIQPPVPPDKNEKCLEDCKGWRGGDRR